MKLTCSPTATRETIPNQTIEIWHLNPKDNDCKFAPLLDIDEDKGITFSAGSSADGGGAIGSSLPTQEGKGKKQALALRASEERDEERLKKKCMPKYTS